MAVPIPPPPRLSGDPFKDYPTLVAWLHEFYRAAIVENGIIESSAFEAAVHEQIDPASATAATAQKTANQALVQTSLIRDGLAAGAFTISDTDTQAVVTLTPAQADTGYYVVAVHTAISGAPAATSDEIASIAKTTADFTVTVKAAPGAGTSVTFDWQLMRAL
jgi:hypothetical protein